MQLPIGQFIWCKRKSNNTKAQKEKQNEKRNKCWRDDLLRRITDGEINEKHEIQQQNQNQKIRERLQNK